MGKMHRRLCTLVVLLGLAVRPGLSQQNSPNHLYDRIQLHIDRDEKYSQLFAIKFWREELPQSLRNSFRKCNEATIHLKGNDRADSDTSEAYTSYQYQLIYVTSNGSEPTLLTLRELAETYSSGGLYKKSTTKVKRSPVVLLTVRDFFEMKNCTTSQTYKELQEFVRKRHREENRIGPDFRGDHSASSLVADNNRDYLRFALIHSSLPVEEAYFDGPVSLDATFSRLSVSSKIFSERTWLGLRGFGVEFGFGDRVLNLLSYQAPYLAWGVRFLIVPAGSSADLATSFFVDLQIKGRSPLNTNRFIMNANLHRATPVFSLNPGRLNVTSGVAFEAQMGRPFNDRLPFLSFYYSGGTKDFAKPDIHFIQNGMPSAYFSTIQWEASFSYFWNLDNAAFNRIRLDIGAGSYNVWQVEYDSAMNSIRSSSLISPLTQVRPLITVNYTHASDDAKFGVGVRFFDNRLALTPWIKIFESISHQVRVEFMAITRTVGRGFQPWEAEKGSLLQLRYRYGFSESLR